MAESELVDQVLDILRNLLMNRSQTMPPSWLELDLSMAQLKALFALAYATPTTISGLGETLGVGLPAASHLVERLVQAGLATRVEDAQDRRRALVSLTDAGQELAERLQAIRREELRQLLALIKPADLAALTQGLRAMLAAAESLPT